MTEFEKFYNISLLRDIPEEEVKLLFNSCKRVTFKQNDIIMEEDEDECSMFFFIEGEVVISNVITMKVSNQAGYSEVDKQIVKLKAESVGTLGEMSVFEEQKRSATVKASEPCILYEIGKKDFEDFINQHPDIGVKILFNIAKVLCARVRRSNNDKLKLTTALSIALSR
jgi:CRP/FNR family transcriptional regulator, cyclic AMP receptor protein